MRKLFVVIALAVALFIGVLAPAVAGNEWFIVYGTGFPKDVRSGPYDSVAACSQAMSAFGWYWPYHCELIYVP